MHRNDIVQGNPGDGDTVYYDVGTDERSGKLNARNVTVEGGGTGQGKSYGKGFGGGGGKYGGGGGKYGGGGGKGFGDERR